MKNNTSNKIAHVAKGGTTILLAGITSNSMASIVQSPTVGSGVSTPSSTGTTTWDIDGDSVNEFELTQVTSATPSNIFAYFNSAPGAFGRLVVPGTATNNGIAKLNYGFEVGATLASGNQFLTAPQNSNSVTTYGTNVGGDAANGGWSIGDTGFFGFRFQLAGNTHYGWGELMISGLDTGTSFIIMDAYFENTPDESIEVGQVPEPNVALLALGAAGVAAWRRRRNA